MLNEYIVCTQIKAFSTFLHINIIFSLFLQWECHGIFHLIYVYDCNRIVIHARPPFFQTLFFIGFFRKSLTTQTTWTTNRDRGQRIQNIESRFLIGSIPLVYYMLYLLSTLPILDSQYTIYVLEMSHSSFFFNEEKIVRKRTHFLFESRGKKCTNYNGIKLRFLCMDTPLPNFIKK